MAKNHFKPAQIIRNKAKCKKNGQKSFQTHSNNKKQSKMAKTNFMVLRYNFWRRQKSEKSSSDIN